VKQFTTSTGTGIAYRDTGEGRPLVLLHGLLAHGGFFEAQQPLADSFQLIQIDLRGHGRSEAGADLRFDRLAADVAELAAALDLRDAIGVGWSLGAAILWRVLSGSQGGRFAGSVIVDMTPRVLNGGDWQLGLSREHCEARSAAMLGDFAAFASAAGQAIFAQPLRDGTRKLADWASLEFLRNDPAAIHAVWTSLVEQDFRPDLPAIAQPSLIVHGAHSQLYGPETAAYLARSLPQARAVRFAQSGHAPHLEESGPFNRLVRDFAASLPEARAHATA